jgi:hypothetical protein
MKRPLRSSARGANFHTKYASNANVVRIALLDANTYLAYRVPSTSFVLKLAPLAGKQMAVFIEYPSIEHVFNIAHSYLAYR